MSFLKVFIKDPDAVLDYAFDWADWLATGETISTATWVVPTGITKNSDSKTSTTATIWLSAGVADTDYTITCHIKTTASPAREDDRSFLVKVRNR